LLVRVIHADILAFQILYTKKYNDNILNLISSAIRRKYDLLLSNIEHRISHFLSCAFDLNLNIHIISLVKIF